MVCYDGVMAQVETTRHFNVYGFGTSFIDEIVMKLNEVDFLFNVNPGHHVVNVENSGVRFGFFGYSDNDFADEVKSSIANTLFINAATDGNELTVWSKNHSCSELRVIVEHDSHEVSDKIEWIKQ